MTKIQKIAAAAALVVMTSASLAAAMWPTKVELNETTFNKAIELLRTTVEEEKQFAKTNDWEDHFYSTAKEKRFCRVAFYGDLHCYVKQEWGETDRMFNMLFKVSVNEVADQFLECLDLRRTEDGFEQVCTGTSFGDTKLKVITFTFKLNS